MNKEGYGIPNVSHLFFDCKVERTWSTVYLYITFMVTCCYLSHPLILPRIPRLSKCMVAMSHWVLPTFSGAGVGGREGASGPTSRLAFFGWEQLKRVDGFPVLKQGKHHINHLYKPMSIFLYVFIHKNHLSFETEIFFLLKRQNICVKHHQYGDLVKKRIILAIRDGRMLGFHHISPEDTTFHVINAMLVRILIKQGFSMVKFFKWLRAFARLSTYIQTAKRFISIELPAVWRYLHTSKMSHSTPTENGCLEDASEIETCSYESLQLLARKGVPTPFHGVSYSSSIWLE